MVFVPKPKFISEIEEKLSEIFLFHSESSNSAPQAKKNRFPWSPRQFVDGLEPFSVGFLMDSENIFDCST